MRKLVGMAVLFLSFIGVSFAQHSHMGGGQSHSSPHFSPRGGGVVVHPNNNFHSPAVYRGWYYGRPGIRGFGWGHYYGWRFHPYVYLGANYCYTGMWGAPYFTFGFNASRWRVADFDLSIVDGWYPASPMVGWTGGGCAYVVADPDHYGWFLLYDQQTGQYVHVEQY